MDPILFSYLLKNQSLWREQYKKNKKSYKLIKNREEKQRAKLNSNSYLWKSLS